MKIVPTGTTVRDMKGEAAEFEQQARVETDPVAAMLKDKAAVLREWIASLKTGSWTS